MTVENIITVLDRFSDTEIVNQEPSIEKGRRMIGLWKRGLYGCVEELVETGEIGVDFGVRIRQAVDDWSEEDPNKPDHKAFHSYYVYEGEKFLARMDGKEKEVDDRVLQVQAVLHDIMQTLPATLAADESRYKDDQRKDHAKLGSLVIRKFGSFFGLNPDTTHQIALSIRHHDATQEGRDYKPRSYGAELLADADKLFGASLSRDPQIMSHDLIQRNLVGGQKEEGWYLLRDLSQDEIAQWQYGDRWFSDARSAVWKAVTGTEFFTESARRFNEVRKDAFFAQARLTYGDFYSATSQHVQEWIKDPNSVTVYQTGKDQQKKVIQGDPYQLIQEAYTNPLNLSKTDRLRRTPYGRKIVICRNGTEESFILDPSVARFCFNENGDFQPEAGKKIFLNQLLSAFKESA